MRSLKFHEEQCRNVCTICTHGVQFHFLKDTRRDIVLCEHDECSDRTPNPHYFQCACGRLGVAQEGGEEVKLDVF